MGVPGGISFRYTAMQKEWFESDARRHMISAGVIGL
jgi:hypothetical protein